MGLLRYLLTADAIVNARGRNEAGLESSIGAMEHSIGTSGRAYEIKNTERIDILKVCANVCESIVSRLPSLFLLYVFALAWTHSLHYTTLCNLTETAVRLCLTPDKELKRRMVRPKDGRLATLTETQRLRMRLLSITLCALRKDL